MKDILAVVTGISQVFYLTGNSKCFMIDIAFLKNQDGNLEKSTVVARLSGLHESFKIFQSLPIHASLGKIFRFRNITRAVLTIPSAESKVTIYEADSQSTVEEATPSEVDHFKLQDIKISKDQTLSSYNGGIVTDDTSAADGIYILDKKITLIITHMAVISNVHFLCRGQRVELVDCHHEKIAGKDIFYPCGRGLVRSLQLTEEAPSIHSTISIRRFLTSPLVQACLQFNLKIDQILEFQDLLLVLKNKFGEGFVAQLAEYFSEKTNLVRFVETLDVAAYLFHAEPRSMIQEYFANPHTCSLRDTNRKRGPSIRDAPNFGKTFMTVRHFLDEANKMSCKIMEQNMERYRSAGSTPKFDCCIFDGNKVCPDKKLLGKISIDRLTGRFELSDKTGSIPLAFLAPKFPDTTDNFIDQVVKLENFRICYEVSGMGNKPWSILYLVCDPMNVRNILCCPEPVIQVKEETISRKWRVLYGSGAIFSRDEVVSMFCAVRDLSKAFTQPLFVRLPLTLRPQVQPGSELHYYSNESIGEKKSWDLSYHCRKVGIPHQEAVYLPLSDVRVEPGVIVNHLDYKLEEFEKIPTNELVNILCTISERWLERQEKNYSTADFLKEESPITNCSIQLKLIDPRASSQGTISLFITHWSSHPYPLGLLPHASLRICNVLKLTSNKGNSYFTSSLFTTFHILKIEQQGCLIDELIDGYNEIGKEEKEADDGHSRDFIIDLLHPTQMKSLFEFTVTLETIMKVSIIARCMGCNTILHNKRCDFVGCHLGDQTKPEFEARCAAMVEDETQSAMVQFQGCQTIQELLNFSQTEWDAVLEMSFVKGEVLYLANKGKQSLQVHLVRRTVYDFAEYVFQSYCDSFPKTIYRKFKLKCRPFRASKLGDNVPEMLAPKLFCISLAVI